MITLIGAGSLLMAAMLAMYNKRTTVMAVSLVSKEEENAGLDESGLDGSHLHATRQGLHSRSVQHSLHLHLRAQPNNCSKQRSRHLLYGNQFLFAEVKDFKRVECRYDGNNCTPEFLGLN